MSAKTKSECEIWAQGRGVIQHNANTQQRIKELAEYLLAEHKI